MGKIFDVQRSYPTGFRGDDGRESDGASRDAPKSQRGLIGVQKQIERQRPRPKYASELVGGAGKSDVRDGAARDGDVGPEGSGGWA